MLWNHGILWFSIQLGMSSSQHIPTDELTPSFFRGVGSSKPPTSYDIPYKSPWNQHFPMVFLWFSYGFPMVFLWFSYGFPMVCGWNCYEDMSAVDDLSYLSTIRSCANQRQLSQGIQALLVEGEMAWGSGMIPEVFKVSDSMSFVIIYIYTRIM